MLTLTALGWSQLARGFVSQLDFPVDAKRCHTRLGKVLKFTTQE